MESDQDELTQCKSANWVSVTKKKKKGKKKRKNEDEVMIILGNFDSFIYLFIYFCISFTQEKEGK